MFAAGLRDGEGTIERARRERTSGERASGERARKK
jgi:hypothetical protein